MGEFHKSLARAVHACQSTDIPVEDNFRALYWDIGQGLFPDWKMSELGAGLFIVNSETDKPQVAKAQMTLLSLVFK